MFRCDPPRLIAGSLAADRRARLVLVFLIVLKMLT
jgi:hypothetical protein